MNVIELLRANWWAFLIGIVIRFAFAPFTGHPYDMAIWVTTGRQLYLGQSPYSPYDHLGQPIVWGLWLWLSYIVASIGGFDIRLFALVVKIPLIFVDMAMPFAILHILRRNMVTFSRTKLLFRVLLLNPVGILISGFWAMPDQLAILLVLLAMGYHDNIRLVIVLLVLSIALKLYPIVLVPAFVLVALRGSFRKGIILSLGVVLGIVLVSYLPFILMGWNEEEMSGVLSSQSARSFGVLSIFYSMTLLAYHLGTPEFVTLMLRLDISLWVKFIWVTVLFIFWISTLLKLRNGSIASEFPNDFLLLLDLILVHYGLWMAFAPWVSEQNTYGFLVLLLVKGSVSDQAFLGVHFTMSATVVAYAVHNLPFFSFFHLVYSQATIDEWNRLLSKDRNLKLAAIGILHWVLLLLGIEKLIEKLWRSSKG